MKSLENDQIARNTDEKSNYSTEELSAKLYDYVVNNKDMKNRINVFNNNYRYTTFLRSLSFHLGRSIIKHCSPMEIVNWKIGVKDNEIMNDNDKTTMQARSIVNDFINAESKKVMERITVYRDKEYNGEIQKNVRVLDYSVVITPEQFPIYRSILFNDNNQELIKHYYFEFIYFFLVTRAEFEKTFFYFLTLLADKQYPGYTNINDVYAYIKEINEIVKMRYIDIEDRFLLAFLYIISTDKELQKTCNDVYAEIKHIEDLTRKQFENMSS